MTKRKARYKPFGADAIDPLGIELETDDDVSTLDVNLDAVAGRLARDRRLRSLDDAESEGLDGLLEYLGRRKAAMLARRLYRLAHRAGYDPHLAQSAIRKAESNREKLVEELFALVLAKEEE
jgi:hypothetical protein